MHRHISLTAIGVTQNDVRTGLPFDDETRAAISPKLHALCKASSGSSSVENKDSEGAEIVTPLARFSDSHNLSRSAADARALDSQAVRGEAQARGVRVIISGGKTGVLDFFKHNAEVHVGKIRLK
jgi:hypothetical protein